MFQLLFLIGWIGIFILSAVGVADSFMTDEIKKNMEVYETYKYIDEYILKNISVIVLGTSVFYLVLSIKKFLSLFKGKEDKVYIFESESGLISLSYAAVECVIKKVIDDENYIIGRKIRIKEKRKKLILNVKIECESVEGVTEKIVALQRKIEREIDRITAIKTDKINIKVAKMIDVSDEKISTEGE